MSGSATLSAGGPAAGAAPDQPIPWFGLAAVLLGTFLSTLNGRFSTFGLGDMRGAVHASFDAGAWITTAQTVAQMLVLPAAIWLGGVFGPRRALLEAAAAYAVISFLEPFSPNLPMLIGLQFAGGLASGFFIPLTLGFILKTMPPRMWAYGIALYALNLELSLNISASLEGWYVDHLSWRWIFWQNVPLALGMFALLRLGVRPDPPIANAQGRRVRAGHQRRGAGADLRRPGPGQPAGLAQFRPDLGAAPERRDPGRALLHPRAANAPPRLQPRGGGEATASAPADHDRVPAADHPLDRLPHPPIPGRRARLPGPGGGPDPDLDRRAPADHLPGGRPPAAARGPAPDLLGGVRPHRWGSSSSPSPA